MQWRGTASSDLKARQRRRGAEFEGGGWCERDDPASFGQAEKMGVGKDTGSVWRGSDGGPGVWDSVARSRGRGWPLGRSSMGQRDFAR